MKILFRLVIFLAFSASLSLATDWPWQVADVTLEAGTAYNPFLISSEEEFNEISQDPFHMDKSFVLTADLDFEGITPNQIGSEENPFIGIFNGLYFNKETGVTEQHTISNLVYSSGNPISCGIFGYVGSEGTIQNISIQSLDITAGCAIRAGGLVGTNYGRLFNCHIASGMVLGFSGVGGIAGYNAGVIEDCSFDGTVQGNDSIGGLCGYMQKGTLISSEFAGLVEGLDITIFDEEGNVESVEYSKYIGGVAGGLIEQSHVYGCVINAQVIGGYYVGGCSGNVASNNIIEQVKTSGTVVGKSFVGGISGLNSGTFQYCVSTASVTADNVLAYGDNEQTLEATAYTGGFVGRNNGGLIKDSYATGSVSSFIGVNGFDVNEFVLRDGVLNPAVIAANYAGGFAGSNSGTIQRSYCIGSVSGDLLAVANPSIDVASYPFISDRIAIGGFTGQNNSAVSYCYFDEQTTQQSGATSDGGIAMQTADMMLQATYVSWNFSDKWFINGMYPQLIWEPNLRLVTDSFKSNFNAGDTATFKIFPRLTGAGEVACNITVAYGLGSATGWLLLDNYSPMLTEAVDTDIECTVSTDGLANGLYTATVTFSAIEFQEDIVFNVKIYVGIENGDINVDGESDLTDFAFIASQFKSGVLDLDDLINLIDGWLK